MSFVDFLERVRARPEAERRSLAFWSSLVITLVVAAIWVASLSFNLRRPVALEAPAEPSAATSTTELGWWAKNTERIKTGWKTVKTKI
jgi:hypothetical protein